MAEMYCVNILGMTRVYILAHYCKEQVMYAKCPDKYFTTLVTSTFSQSLHFKHLENVWHNTFLSTLNSMYMHNFYASFVQMK